MHQDTLVTLNQISLFEVNILFLKLHYLLSGQSSLILDHRIFHLSSNAVD